MTPTLPISVPTYQIAAGALLRLSKPFFDRSLSGPDTLQAETVWKELRGLAMLLLERGRAFLGPEELDRLGILLADCAEMQVEGPIIDDVVFLSNLPFIETERA
jgi:hypothetical protein